MSDLEFQRWETRIDPEVLLQGTEWISLPIELTDWTGDWLWTLPISVDLPDGVAGDWLNLDVRRDDWAGSWTVPASVDIPPGTIGRTEHRPLAVKFQELSLSVDPHGRVATPVLDAAR